MQQGRKTGFSESGNRQSFWPGTEMAKNISPLAILQIPRKLFKIRQVRMWGVA
jgi:hypothetical protein